MLKMTFRPKLANNLSLILGTVGYQEVWQSDGERILSAFKQITGLDVDRRHITAEVVLGRMSNSGYGRHHMLLGVRNFDRDAKTAVLMHELAHRLLTTNDIYTKNRKSAYWRKYRQHQVIYLFLYDAMLQLYGKEFADKEVMRDSAGATFYGKAWKWALVMSPEQRQKEFAKIVARKSSN